MRAGDPPGDMQSALARAEIDYNLPKAIAGYIRLHVEEHWLAAEHDMGADESDMWATSWAAESSVLQPLSCWGAKATINRSLNSHTASRLPHCKPPKLKILFNFRLPDSMIDANELGKMCHCS